MKNVDPKVVKFLEKNFGVKDIQLCDNATIVAAMEFLAVAEFFKKSEEDYADIKKSAAELMYKTLGIAHPDYSTQTKLLTIAMMRTKLFQEGARA